MLVAARCRAKMPETLVAGEGEKSKLSSIGWGQVKKKTQKIPWQKRGGDAAAQQGKIVNIIPKRLIQPSNKKRNK